MRLVRRTCATNARFKWRLPLVMSAGVMKMGTSMALALSMAAAARAAGSAADSASMGHLSPAMECSTRRYTCREWGAGEMGRGFASSRGTHTRAHTTHLAVFQVSGQVIHLAAATLRED